MSREVDARTVLVAAALVLVAAAPADHGHDAHRPAAAGERYHRATVRITPPDVELVDAASGPVSLATVLAHEGPLLVQFIFTTCPAVCPTLSTAFAGLESDPLPGARRVSITVDPEHDTPARLRDHAASLGASTSWRFLTGRRDDVDAVQRAFGVYRANKMRHEPFTFLRVAPGTPWIRLAGYPTAADLHRELRHPTS